MLISICQEALRSNSKNFIAYKDRLEELNSRLDALIAEISESWEGDSSKAYIAKLMAYSQDAKKMISVLERYQQYVDDVVIRVDDFDKKFSNLLRSIM